MFRFWAAGSLVCSLTFIPNGSGECIAGDLKPGDMVVEVVANDGGHCGVECCGQCALISSPTSAPDRFLAQFACIPGPAPSTSTTSPTTVTTSTTTVAPRTPAWSPETAVQELNAMYMAFEQSDDTTALGVTVGFPGQLSSFDDNLYCNDLVGTSCYQGQADCKMSASVLNHKVMVRPLGDGFQVVPVMGRSVGYVFNQTLTENYFGKCTYIFDGADGFNVNQGCGSSAPPPNSCDNPNSAFYNMCTADGGQTFHHCVATDPEIESRKCRCESDSCSSAYGTMDPPRFRTDVPCFYEMPALIVPPDASAFIPSSTNHLRDAMTQRVTSDEITNQAQEWNEMVIDERLLIPQIINDPSHTIVAFVYVSGTSLPDETARSFATNMRDQFQQAYHVHGVGDIPVLEMDANNDFTQSGGPFKLPSQSSVVLPPVVV